MKKIMLIAVAVLSMTTSALFATDSPLKRSIKEIDAIIDSDILEQRLGEDSSIKMIKRIKNNSYIILTDNKKMMVDLVYTSKDGDFELQFRDPMPLSEED